MITMLGRCGGGSEADVMFSMSPLVKLCRRRRCASLFFPAAGCRENLQGEETAMRPMMAWR